MAGVTVVFNLLGHNMILNFGVETAKDEDEIKELVIADLQSETQISPRAIGFQPNQDDDFEEEDKR